jgi:hypothetical protein
VSVRRISPGEVAADRFGGSVSSEDVPILMAALDRVARFNDAVDASETTRAGPRPSAADEVDSMHCEDFARRYFASLIGRPPAPWELSGPPAAGCHACAAGLGLRAASPAAGVGDPAAAASVAV